MVAELTRLRIHEALVAAHVAREVARPPLAPPPGPAGTDVLEACVGLQLRPGRGAQDDDLLLDGCYWALAVASGADPRRLVRTVRERRRSPCACGRTDEACGAWPEGMPPPGRPGEASVFGLGPGVALARRVRGGSGITALAGDLARLGDLDVLRCLEAAARTARGLPILAILLERPGGKAPDPRRALAGLPAVGLVEAAGHDLAACWIAASEAVGIVRRDRRPVVLVGLCGRDPPAARGAALPAAEGAAAGTLTETERDRDWARSREHLAPCREEVRVAVDGSWS